jgi:iron complex transport system substrate-binding protein
MKKMFRPMLKAALCCVLFGLLLTAGIVAEGSQEETTTQPEIEKAQETIVLTDNIGREVELPYPVTRAVAANRYNSELIRASGAIEYMIWADLNTIQDRSVLELLYRTFGIY